MDLLSPVLPPAPAPTNDVTGFTAAEIAAEAKRLAAAINDNTRWDTTMCMLIAPLTLEINRLKAEKNVFIMAHSYQTPDIIYGVADATGDSYGLAKLAKEIPQKTILFSSVRFMAETAKIVNPAKIVLHPTPSAGCSLADGINAADVRGLKAANPGVPVVCYVNTTAAVKAECDACVTSSNYLDICKKLPGNELIFVPDAFMGKHLQAAIPEKTIHLWDAVCEVHEKFTGAAARAWKVQAKAEGRDMVVLAHPECDADVLAEADYIGSTEKMMDYARELEANGRVDIMPITECGTADRMRAEMPGLNVMGACVLCPHMKKTDLSHILQALQNPTAKQIIELDPAVAEGAIACLDKMFELA
jgi:quinolinate synthase